MIDTPGAAAGPAARHLRFDAVVVIPFDRAFPRLDGPAFVERRSCATSSGPGRSSSAATSASAGTGGATPRSCGGSAGRPGSASTSSPRLVLGGRDRQLEPPSGAFSAAAGSRRPRACSAGPTRSPAASSGRQRGPASSAFRPPTSRPRTRSCPRGLHHRDGLPGPAIPSVTSIGTNPTFGPHPLSVETPPPRFPRLALRGRDHRPLPPQAPPDADLPGRRALAVRIRRDVEDARAWFDRRG